MARDKEFPVNMTVAQMNALQRGMHRVGELADTCDNLLGALKLPLRPELHLQGVKAGLEDMSKELKEIYVLASGENPWEI